MNISLNNKARALRLYFEPWRRASPRAKSMPSERQTAVLLMHELEDTTPTGESTQRPARHCVPKNGQSSPNLSDRDFDTGKAFDQIYREYGSYVMGLIRLIGVREAFVEDVHQEVFLAVHQQSKDFEGRSSLKTWITGIARNKAYDCMRKEWKKRNDGDEALNVIEDSQ